MIRYTADLGNEYFVEFFRKSTKHQNRVVAPKPDEPAKKISVVTTCMNRLSDLRRTLPKNLEDNADYPAEFVLLDYDSKDGLEDWVRAEMAHHIEGGRLVYYRALGQRHFRPNHSRNVSFRLATGDLVTNVDADNFMHAGFLHRLNQCSHRPKLLIVPESFLKPGSNRLILRGRFAMRRKEIMELGGFDEELDEGYSQDDVNFVLRALLNGFSFCRFEDSFLEGRIETDMAERVKLVQRPVVGYIKKRNADLTRAKLSRGVIEVNKGRNWGSATVIKNFSERIEL